jgi:hypothetical protein
MALSHSHSSVTTRLFSVLTHSFATSKNLIRWATTLVEWFLEVRAKRIKLMTIHHLNHVPVYLRKTVIFIYFDASIIHFIRFHHSVYQNHKSCRSLLNCCLFEQYIWIIYWDDVSTICCCCIRFAVSASVPSCVKCSRDSCPWHLLASITHVTHSFIWIASQALCVSENSVADRSILCDALCVLFSFSTSFLCGFLGLSFDESTSSHTAYDSAIYESISIRESSLNDLPERKSFSYPLWRSFLGVYSGVVSSATLAYVRVNCGAKLNFDVYFDAFRTTTFLFSSIFLI